MKSEKEIKAIKEKRQRPLTEREDAMESLENVALEIMSLQEEYEQWQKEIEKEKQENKK